MSGVELVGLAASILQIADLGWKLSYKLYAFSKKVHEAPKTIELFSQDISATGAVLKQFADELDKDEKASASGRLASLELIKAARGIVEECETLFKEIDASIDGGGGSKAILGLKAKLKWSYLEPRLQLLSLNLGRLKASVALMLNVLVYAEQIRGREARKVLLEQKDLIESFAAQKNDMAEKVEQLSKRIEQAPESVTKTETIQPAEKPMQQPVDDFNSSGTRNIQPHNNTGTSTTRDIPADSPQDFFKVKAFSTTAADSSIMLQASEPQSSSTDFSTLVEEPAKPSAEIVDLEHQLKLIEKLLEVVSSSNYAIDHGARYKFHDGVLGLHWQVWEPLRWSHGDDVLRKLLSRSPVLARHWHERTLKEHDDFLKLSLRSGSFRALSSLGGEMPSHTSPSNKIAWALQADLLKEEQRESKIKLGKLRAEQDALQEKGNSRSRIEKEEFDRRIRDQTKMQAKAEQTTPRDEGNLRPEFAYINQQRAPPQYLNVSQKLPYDENEAYKAIGKHMEAALKEGKLRAASTDIADTLISQWTTVSPPAIRY